MCLCTDEGLVEGRRGLLKMRERNEVVPQSNVDLGALVCEFK